MRAETAFCRKLEPIHASYIARLTVGRRGVNGTSSVSAARRKLVEAPSNFWSSGCPAVAASRLGRCKRTKQGGIYGEQLRRRSPVMDAQSCDSTGRDKVRAVVQSSFSTSIGSLSGDVGSRLAFGRGGASPCPSLRAPASRPSRRAASGAGGLWASYLTSFDPTSRRLRPSHNGYHLLRSSKASANCALPTCLLCSCSLSTQLTTRINYPTFLRLFPSSRPRGNHPLTIQDGRNILLAAHPADPKGPPSCAYT
jgi:hypothetical protein